jgi:hypothetical protein
MVCHKSLRSVERRLPISDVGIKRTWTQKLSWRYLPWVLAIVFFLICVGRAYDHETVFTGLIYFGGNFAESVVPAVQEMDVVVREGNYGYDGQFYAQLASDPLLLNADTITAMDNPSYRARRILVSALSHLMALGNPQWSIHAYSLINVAFWLGLAAFLAVWIRESSIQATLRWIGCIFSLGVVTSVTHGLLELPALFFSLLALFAYSRGTAASAGLALSASVLSKETFLLTGLAFVTREKPVKGGLVFILSLIPFAIWLLYLWIIQLPQNTGNSGNFQAPFSGLWFEATSTLEYLQEGKIHNLLAFAALLYQCGYLIARPRPDSLLWRSSVPYMVLAVFLGVAVWESEPGAAYRVLVPVAVVFNLLLRPGRWFPFHWMIGNASLIISIKYLLRMG